MIDASWQRLWVVIKARSTESTETGDGSAVNAPWILDVGPNKRKACLLGVEKLAWSEPPLPSRLRPLPEPRERPVLGRIETRERTPARQRSRRRKRIHAGLISGGCSRLEGWDGQ